MMRLKPNQAFSLPRRCQKWQGRSIDMLIWHASHEVAKVRPGQEPRSPEMLVSCQAVALFGPGVVVLPLLGRVSGVDEEGCLECGPQCPGSQNDVSWTRFPQVLQPPQTRCKGRRARSRRHGNEARARGRVGTHLPQLVCAQVWPVGSKATHGGALRAKQNIGFPPDSASICRS